MIFAWQQLISRITRAALLPATCLCLGGCLHLQLGGAVTEAGVTITPLRDPSTIIEQLGTPSLSQVREDDGPGRWDNRRDLGRFTFLGNVTPDETLYDPGALYLVTASGGFDQDADSNNALDAEPAAVAGQWHAILTGDQLSRGKVSPLTEAVYRYLELNLDSLSDEEVIAEMNRLAALMVPDIDRSGTFDYEDLLLWNRHFTAKTYLHDIARVDELSDALRNSASAATLRSLGLAVIGTDAESSGPFTVAGSVTVSATTRVDSDVNNPQAPYASNDLFSLAQPLINPVILGGYVNLPGEGSEGDSRDIGDFDDFYRVNLLAGQRITLVMSEDPAFNDIDLFLYDQNFNLIDVALGIVEVEQITVPADGDYYVLVNAFEGASNYQLTVGIGELSPELEAQQLRLSADFVPGEIIATFGNRQDPRMLRRYGRLQGMRVLAGGAGRDNLLELESTGPRVGKWRQKRKLRTLKAVKRLRRQSEVEVAELNYYVKPYAVPDDVYYNRQRWHYEMISLPAAWENSLGDDVIVAVVDTGIRSNHPDLAGQLVPGYDFVSNLSQAGDGDGRDSNPEDPGDSDSGTPSSFHGTHVAGTVAAATNNNCANGTCQGVAGVAWNAKIMPLRALGIGGGTTFDVREAVRYAAGLSSIGQPARRADVINLSLGGGGFSAIDQALYDQIADLGIVVVAAAGNESSSQFSYPASYNNVISVSAVNINRQRAPYSNFGSRVDVAAPGGDSSTRDVNGDGVADLILSTSADDSNPFSIRDTYTLLQGTSMASPHVAGVVALMKSVYPTLTAGDFEDLLAEGIITDDLGSSGRDNTYGWGLINANKAVLVAQGLASGSDVLNQPRVAASTSSLNFGNFADTLLLTVSNSGTGKLEGVSLEVGAGAPWLSFTENAVDSNGVGGYDIHVDRSQLAVGSYSGGIKVSSTNGGETSVLVIVQQPDPSALTEGDAGLHYILLVNSEDESVGCEVSTTVTSGNYAFEFRNVPPGSYLLYAGSDADNDFFICDPGEACGAWPVIDVEPIVIDVRQNLNGLTFSSTYSTGIIELHAAGGATGHQPIRRSSYRGGTRPNVLVEGQTAIADCGPDF